MRITLRQAKCGTCKEEFFKPTLGDMSYGEFVFTGERGTVHAYFCAFDPGANALWELFASRLPASLAPSAAGTVIQSACAHFADPIEEQRLTNKQVCPHCQSSNFEFWAGKPLDVVDVPDVTFEQFTGLDEPTKERLLNEFFEPHTAMIPAVPRRTWLERLTRWWAK